MGYCISLKEAKFRIPQCSVYDALQALKSLAGKETIRDSSGRHFSWVHTQTFLDAETLREAMEAWRWPVEVDWDGNIVDIDFAGQKLGDDELFFRTLAPFVEDGSYIAIQGEDDDIWRWVFENGQMREQHAVITWKD